MGARLRVLSPQDIESWEENGYFVLRQAAPANLIADVIDATWAFMEMDRDNPETWHRQPERLNGMPELNGAGMVEMYNHPALWAIRQLPRIHGAFADLWDTEKLWVTIDRVNFNPPRRDQSGFKGFIHWDIDSTLDPLPFDTQGVLSLTDTPAGCGGFQCVPGMPKRLPEWRKTQPADRNPHRPGLAGLTVETVPTQAGDLIIWNSLLAHGTSPNTGDHPRFAQYISMSPAQQGNQTARDWRINSWLHRVAPEGNAFPGDPRSWEPLHGTTAALSPLGRKLLGLDLWDQDHSAEQIGEMRLDQGTGRKRATPGFAG